MRAPRRGPMAAICVGDGFECLQSLSNHFGYIYDTNGWPPNWFLPNPLLTGLFGVRAIDTRISIIAARSRTFLRLERRICWLDTALETVIHLRPRPVGTPGIEPVLAKAGYDPDEPRDDYGRWTTGNLDGSTARANSANSQIKPGDREQESFWETLAHETETAISEIGQAEISENKASTAAATAVANGIVGNLKAYANYRAQPWVNSAGISVQVPIQHRRSIR